MQQMIDQENVPPSNNKPRPGFAKFLRVQEERDTYKRKSEEQEVIIATLRRKVKVQRKQLRKTNVRAPPLAERAAAASCD